MRPVVLIVSGMLMMMTGPASAPADTYDSAERTATHSIASKALGEQRDIIVRTPPGYDPTRDYPVVYAAMKMTCAGHLEAALATMRHLSSYHSQ